MLTSILTAVSAVTVAVVGFCMGCFFERHRSVLRSSRLAPAKNEVLENLLCDRIDFSISLYTRLLEFGCEDLLLLEIAGERIEANRRKLEEFKLRQFESQVAK